MNRRIFIIQEKIDTDEYIDIWKFESTDIRRAKKVIKEMRKNKHRILRLIEKVY